MDSDSGKQGAGAKPAPAASAETDVRVAIIGASGAIGCAIADAYEASGSVHKVLRLSRSENSRDNSNDQTLRIDICKEETIARAAGTVERLCGELDIVIVATGILHDRGELMPEKSWRDLNPAAFETLFRVNCIGPALVAKHFLPLLSRQRRTIFAALSARVGSIGDNRLGGWHAYRASKSALNMVIKSLSIELARTNPRAICVGLHPGTVDSALSKPFQRSVAKGRLFRPMDAARCLIETLNGLTETSSGNVYAWDGRSIPH